MREAKLEAWLSSLFERRGKRFPSERIASVGLGSGEHRLQLEVVLASKASGVIVFMPGTNAYALLYADLLVALADRGFHVVGFDPRGHGRSGGARGSYTMPELVEDMRRVIAYARERFNLPVVAAGSSQGGITSLYTASTGEPLAGILCHNLADLADPESIRCTRLPRWMGGIRPVLRWATPWLGELPIPMNLYLDLANEPVAGVGNAWGLIKDDPLLVASVRLKTMASLGSAQLPRPVETIQCPVFVLHGGNDQIFPLDYIQKIYARIRAPKQFLTVPGAAHYMIVDHIDAYIEPVTRWLTEVFQRARAEQPDAAPAEVVALPPKPSTPVARRLTLP